MKRIDLVANTDIEKMNRDELLAAVKRGLAREDAMAERAKNVELQAIIDQTKKGRVRDL